MRPGVWLAASMIAGLAAAQPVAERTRMVAIEVDRDQARVLGSAVKERPFLRVEDEAAPRAYAGEGPAQVEVALLGPKGARTVVRRDVRGLCLAHAAHAEPHVLGDTIELHRESFVVEVPDLPGHDRVEIAYYEGSGPALSRRSLGTNPLDEPSPLTSGAVLWPEHFGDPEVYTVHGNAAEAAERLSVVIVPDGYTYAEKSLMQTHAQALVSYFRTKTPFKEHDPLVNYVLVYAYSVESASDQCDCGIVRDTAMGTRFPASVLVCGDQANRCLYYGSGCDTDASGNIAAAELRAPVVDSTIVMVNTSRYGGCGGARAVYAAANGQAVEIAGHELGHSLAGLADEYGGNGCSIVAGEINTSSNALSGAWPEWIDDIGPPVEGAQYRDACLYRPELFCDMRTLGPPFCRVCQQRWALTFFGHPRVAPTAPVRSTTPPPGTMNVDIGFPVSFGVETRFAVGEAVTNSITWHVGGSPVAAGVTSYQHVFTTPGSVIVRCEVVADTNFVKTEKNGANVDGPSWRVLASSFPVPLEVSPPFAPEPLAFSAPDTIVWQERSASGSSAFNLYRNGVCLASRLPSSTFTDPEAPPPDMMWAYLVTGVTSSGEGTMGADSSGTLRVNATPCE